MSYRSASVAFPICWFINIAPKHHATLRPIGDCVCHPKRKLLGLSALGTNRIDYLIIMSNLPGATRIEYSIAARRPTQHATGHASLKGQTFGWTAERWHHIYLAWSFFPPYKCQYMSTRRKTGIACSAYSSSQTLSLPASV